MPARGDQHFAPAPLLLPDKKAGLPAARSMRPFSVGNSPSNEQHPSRLTKSTCTFNRTCNEILRAHLLIPAHTRPSTRPPPAFSRSRAKGAPEERPYGICRPRNPLPARQTKKRPERRNGQKRRNSHCDKHARILIVHTAERYGNLFRSTGISLHDSRACRSSRPREFRRF